VDRAIYDQILLDRAQELGCVVRQETRVAKVERDGDEVSALVLDSGDAVTARYYVDASGAASVLRKALGVPIDEPTTLRNIAIWDYWQNADWAVEIGVGGTRIQVMRLGWGWIWFIPMGPTRTSIGLVVPASYYKQSGLRPVELYEKAIREEPRIAGLLSNATSEGKLESTKDWSHLAQRHYGKNWFLVGECSGFADPILSAGVTMAQVSARQLAYTIAEIDRGEHDAGWLREQFEHGQKERILTHIRFGDYWYTANAQFTDLQGFTAELAKDAGLDLTPDKAWAWISQGGFITHDLRIGTGGFSINGARTLGHYLSDLDVNLAVERNNVFRLNLKGATRRDTAVYHQGRVYKETSYVRGERVLPLFSQVLMVVEYLQKDPRLPVFLDMLQQLAKQDSFVAAALPEVPEVLEALVTDGWVEASYDPRLPILKKLRENGTIHLNRDATTA
jgi:flavin-dependent dehydrogenase